jgi:hypothetical protein
MSALQSTICGACLPYTCQCETHAPVSCEDCLVSFPEDEIAACGVCSMTLCESCIEDNGQCCRGEGDEDWFSNIADAGGF